MKTKTATAWAIVDPRGCIWVDLIRDRRQEAQQVCVERARVGDGPDWSGLYRSGWRCVRVVIGSGRIRVRRKG